MISESIFYFHLESRVRLKVAAAGGGLLRPPVVAPPCVVEVAEVLAGQQELKREQQMVTLPLTSGYRSKGSHAGP